MAVTGGKRDRIVICSTVLLVAVLAMAVSFVTRQKDVFTWKGNATEMQVKVLWNQTAERSTAERTHLCFLVNIAPAAKIVDTLYHHTTDLLFGYGRSGEEMRNAIDDFNFRLHERVWVVIDGKRIHPELCHFERNFGMDNSKDIWLDFSIATQEIKKSRSLALCINSILPNEKTAVFTWKTRRLLMANNKKTLQG